MIVLDIEASGTEPHIHSIVSIGALDFDQPEKRFYAECRIWDGAHIMEDALKVNGMTREAILDPQRMSEVELYDAFVAYFAGVPDHTFGGHNPSFDRDFLHAAALRGHRNWPYAHRTIDTHSLCYMHMVQRGFTPPTERGRSRLNLDAILNYVGIPQEPKPHNALTGALAHAEVLSRLLYGKPLLPEFAEFSVPW